MPMMSPRLPTTARSDAGVACIPVSLAAACAGNWIACSLPEDFAGQFIFSAALMIMVIATVVVCVLAFISLDYINREAVLAAMASSAGGALLYGMLAMPFTQLTLATVGGLLLPLVASLPILAISCSIAHEDAQKPTM